MTNVTIKNLRSGSVPLTPKLAFRDAEGIAKRNLLRIFRTPRQVFGSIVQPCLILLVFRYMVGGAIHIPGVNYVDYLVPAIFLEAVLMGGANTTLALAQDLQMGIIERFRSLPMARSAVLVGRTFADACRNALALVFVIALGVLVGFRFHNSFGACLAGVALIIMFGYCLTCFYATIGLAVRDPQTAQTFSLLPMFVLFFPSSALVPISTMPGWLQPFAAHQPVTVTLNALRALFEGGPVFNDLWQAITWCAGIFLVFLVVSLNLYRRATA